MQHPTPPTPHPSPLPLSRTYIHTALSSFVKSAWQWQRNRLHLNASVNASPDKCVETPQDFSSLERMRGERRREPRKREVAIQVECGGRFASRRLNPNSPVLARGRGQGGRGGGGKVDGGCRTREQRVEMAAAQVLCNRDNVWNNTTKVAFTLKFTAGFPTPSSKCDRAFARAVRENYV